MIAPWFAHSLLWLGFWFAGMVMTGTAMFGHAWISHHREFRADALAAELLGDTVLCSRCSTTAKPGTSASDGWRG